MSLQSVIQSLNGDIGHVEIPMELNDDCDINASNSEGKTPLHLAAQNPLSTVELIKLILEWGADVKAITPDGNTALHLLTMNCERGYVAYEVTGMLLDYGSDVNAVNSIRGETPLLLAVQNKKCSYPEQMIKLLLERGADVKATTQGDGNTALHWIASGSGDLRISIKVVKMLLDHGSDPNAVNSMGETSFLLALRNKTRSPELIKLFLEHGANLKATTPEDGNTPLHRIIIDNEWDLFKYLQILLEYGSDVNAVNSEGNTPLHLFIEHSCSYDILIIKQLLAHGADTSIKNAKGKNAEEVYRDIMEEDDEEVDSLVHMLLIPANEREENKITPLHIACLFHRFDSVHKMLKLGADINATDSFKKTPLYYTLIDSGDDEKYSTVKLLLDYGALVIVDPDDVYVHRGSSLDWMKNKKYRDISHYRYIVLQHLAKLLALQQGLLFKKDINKVMLTKWQDECLHTFQNIVGDHESKFKDMLTCSYEEAKLMRDTKIGESKVSFLDLLLADAKTTMIYAKNKVLIKAFNDKKAMFPIYQGMLNAKIDRVLERLKLIDQAAVVLSEALQFADPTDVFYEKTLSYCSNQELIRIIDKNNEVEILERYEMNRSQMRLC